MCIGSLCVKLSCNLFTHKLRNYYCGIRKRFDPLCENRIACFSFSMLDIGREYVECHFFLFASEVFAKMSNEFKANMATFMRFQWHFNANCYRESKVWRSINTRVEYHIRCIAADYGWAANQWVCAARRCRKATAAQSMWTSMYGVKTYNFLPQSGLDRLWMAALGVNGLGNIVKLIRFIILISELRHWKSYRNC